MRFLKSALEDEPDRCKVPFRYRALERPLRPGGSWRVASNQPVGGRGPFKGSTRS